MKPFDVRLIDPGFGELVTAVLKATKVANGRCRYDRIDKDVSSWHRTLRRHWRKPAGRQEWPSRHSYHGTPLVRVAWWSDRLGRKHWRVRGLRRDYSDYYLTHWPPAEHPLWHVYPDRLLGRQVGERKDLLAACGCGVVGAPEAIGWTGTHCGPCHDRLEAGEPLPEQRPYSVAWKRHTGLVTHVAFLPDGRIVSGGTDGRIVLWQEDGSSEVLLHRPSGHVRALAVSARGLVAASTAAGRLLLRDLEREEDWRTIPLPTSYPWGAQLQFSPDGHQLCVGLGIELYLLDPAQPQPLFRPIGAGLRLVTACFLADGEALIAYEQSGRLLRIAIATGEMTLLREGTMPTGYPTGNGDALEWFPEDDYFAAPAMACSADGQWLVTVGTWDDWAGPHRCHLPTGRWAPLREVALCGVRALAFAGPEEVQMILPPRGVASWALSTAAPRALWFPDVTAFMGGAFLSPGAERLVVAQPDGTLVLYPWNDLLIAAD